jgi:Tol biopolymer transport system component
MALSVILALAVAAPLAFGQDTGSVKGNKKSKIAFTQLRKDIKDPACQSGYNCDATFADERQNSEIWVMDDADGTELRQLTHNNTFDLGAVWSPDGNTIAFYGTQFDADGLKAEFSPQIFVIPADSTDGVAQELTPAIGDENGDGNLTPQDCDKVDPLRTMPCGASWPSWSPDGNKIAFHDSRPQPTVWVIDVAETNAKPTKLKERASLPDWNSHGNQIVYQSGISGNPDIWVMDVADTNGDGKLESSNSINLTAQPFRDQVPNLSPDDSKIVFHSDRDNPGKKFQIGDEPAELNELYVMDLTRDPTSGNITGASNPSNPTRLTKCTWDPVTETCAEPAGSPRNLDPDWSPNGKEIAFDKHVTSDDPLYGIRLADSVLEIFVMDAKDDDGDGQGDNLKQLTQLPSENGHAGWGTS